MKLLDAELIEKNHFIAYFNKSMATGWLIVQWSIEK